VQIKRGFHGTAVEDGPMTWRHVGVYRHVRKHGFRSLIPTRLSSVTTGSFEWKRRTKIPGWVPPFVS
jgi:hypothetical protein